MTWRLSAALHEISTLDVLIVEHAVVFLEVVVENGFLRRIEEIAVNGIADCRRGLDVVVAEHNLIATHDCAERVSMLDD